MAATEKNQVLAELFGDEEDLVQGEEVSYETENLDKRTATSSSPAPEVDLRVHCLSRPSGTCKLNYGRLGAIVGIQAAPFDPKTYNGDDLKPISNENEYGELEIRPASNSIIRWRWAVNSKGERVRRTNTKIVHWSDGSVVIYIGKNSFYLSQKQLASPCILFAKDLDCYECHTELKSRFVLLPVKVTTHESVQNLVDRRFKKHKTRVATSVESFKAQIDSFEKAEKERMQAEEVSKMMHPSADEFEFTTDFLEDLEPDSNSRHAKRLSSDSSEQEEINAKRLMEAKKTKERYEKYIDDNDDFIASEDDEDPPS